MLLGWGDILAMAGYLGAVLWIGFRVARGANTPERYFLAGRALTWPFIGFSLFATNISSSTLIGLAGDAYKVGLVVYNYEWSAVVILVLLVFFFLPVYLRARVYTIPEFLERRYDARARYYVAGMAILGNILLETAGALYAGALVIQQMFPGLSFVGVIWGLTLLAGLYTAAGGLRAVVYTDMLQAVLLLLGSALLSWEVWHTVGGWEVVVQHTPPEMLSLIHPPHDPVLPWPALLTGIPILGIYYWCNNQYMVQRVLGARDLQQGRQGVLFAGLLKLPVLFLMVFPGLLARILYPDLEGGDQIFPRLTMDLLPHGVRALVLTALLAALMSSLDSTLNAASTLITMDFIRKFRPELSSRVLVRTGRIVTLTIMVLGALWAPHIQRFPSLWQYLQAVLAYISPPVVAVFLLGIFWPRATATGAFLALVMGGGLAALLVLFPPGLHFLYVATLLFGFSALVHVVVSLLDRPPDVEAIAPYLWRPACWRAEREALRALPWYRDYRVQSALLLGLTFLVVYTFA